MSCFPPPPVAPINETAAPVAPPTAQAYSLVSIAVAPGFLALVVLSVVSLFRVAKQRGWQFDSHRLLILHCFLFALVRGILLFIPSSIYRELLCHAAPQVALDILPESLYQCVFIVLNCMWTQMFLRVRRVPQRTTTKIFVASYLVLLALLIVGGAILSVCVYFYIPSFTASNNNEHFFARASVWEVLFYSSASVCIIALNIAFGFGIVRILSILPEMLKVKVSSKIFKMRFFVFFSFGPTNLFYVHSIRSLTLHSWPTAATVVKTVYHFALTSSLTYLLKGTNAQKDGFAAIWFFYFFLCEQCPIAICLIFLWPWCPDKSGQYTTSQTEHSRSYQVSEEASPLVDTEGYTSDDPPIPGHIRDPQYD